MSAPDFDLVSESCNSLYSTTQSGRMRRNTKSKTSFSACKYDKKCADGSRQQKGKVQFLLHCPKTG